MSPHATGPADPGGSLVRQAAVAVGLPSALLFLLGLGLLALPSAVSGRWLPAVGAVAMLFAIGCAIGAGLRLRRTLDRQLGTEPRRLLALARALADGAATEPVVPREGDAGSLLLQLGRLQAAQGALHACLHEQGRALQSAAGRIAAGQTELSQRIAAQAEALQQAAASMDELGRTVRQNAERAHQANQLAQGASSVAARGGQVVDQVVDTMRGISDSSNKIADIIGVIDGIAFQTNILALNAAVEAARAGEQGRGFAVVAHEVRMLAQRSAEAAKEIKQLIGASVERVALGTELVDQAGTTMAEIVQSIQRVAGIMGEISTAGVAQSAGFTQLGETVGRMDQATRRTGALLDQGRLAAGSLQQQARHLLQAAGLPHEALPEEVAAPARAERRGPNRATNVTRPDFHGRRDPAPASPAAEGGDEAAQAPALAGTAANAG